jgi:hypothetical protein
MKPGERERYEKEMNTKTNMTRPASALAPRGKTGCAGCFGSSTEPFRRSGSVISSHRAGPRRFWFNSYRFHFLTFFLF